MCRSKSFYPNRSHTSDVIKKDSLKKNCYKGYEFKSNAHLWGIPLLHISFKYTEDKKPVPAKGIIAIGQFSAGVVSIGQFSIGLLSLSQFSISMFSVAQFAIAYYAIAQFAIAKSGIAAFGLFLKDFLFW